MKPFILCLILSALSCPAARVETFTLDLERPQQPFTLSITEATDATVTATLRASGSEFDPAGWTCLLWYGTTSGGITLTNSASSYGSVTWSVPAASVPTNGRYSVQVLGMITNVTEEWGRGAMTVRLNPARDFMPALWNTNSASAIASAAQRSADFVLALVETNTVSPSQLVSATGGLASASSVASLSGSVAVIQSTLPGLATTGSLTAAVAPLVTTGQLTAAVAAIQAADAFWPHNATASSWFTFITNSGAITITGYNIAGGTDVVIPDYINGVPVMEIGVNAFVGSGVRSIVGAGNVVTVGDFAFESCYSLTSVSLPQAQTVGNYAFYCCGGLTSLYFDNDAPTIGIEIFTGITPNQVTNYVTNPTATGWGATFAGMPVVRLPLYADAIYQAGELVATTNLVTDADLAAWWVETEATKLDAQEFDDHVNPAITPDPHPMYPSTNAPVIYNPTVVGGIFLRNVMPTNLTARVFGSNDVLYVIWGN